MRAEGPLPTASLTANSLRDQRLAARLAPQRPPYGGAHPFCPRLYLLGTVPEQPPKPRLR